MFDFQIIVPAFNEEKTLERVLIHARDRGYLEHLVVVDDASTDSTPQILKYWAGEYGLCAIQLEKNCRKEGAIRLAMEALHGAGELKPYTLLLDADAMLIGDLSSISLEEQIQQCINEMRKHEHKALALRIDVAQRGMSTIFESCAFADYSAMQVDQWLIALQGQVWVINGVGGIFETDHLLPILKNMQPDFETGDLLITVKLMSEKRAIGFRPAFAVETFVPVNLVGYFNQRRRWERGTTKVLWNEARFYLGLFPGLRLLALWTVIHLSIYVGLIFSVGLMITGEMDWSKFIHILFISALIWLGLSLVKGVVLKIQRPKFEFFRYGACAVINGLLSLLVTTPARLTGFFEAIFFLSFKSSRQPNSVQHGVNHAWLNKSKVPILKTLDAQICD